MIGIHDIGGYHMGPIETKDDLVFHEPWEGLVFSLTLVSAVQGSWSLAEFRHIIEQMPPAEYLWTPYYVHWLEAVEELCARDGFVTPEELTARRQAIRNGETPPALPVPTDPEVAQSLREGIQNLAYTGLGVRRPDQPRSFQADDRVRARVLAVSGHTRLPWYVWGKPGVVVSYSGTYPLPDTEATGGDDPEPTYMVRFAGTDLWGPGTETNVSVVLSLFESYMDLDPEATAVGQDAVSQ
ncbi:nitrile hydratase subunit beta [Streptomyces sp. NPDC007205]|uniref:nitrile hydratase subunit beta n=1 Tax=Streptomyces sp. NPDC007205 TaxID=3154316 RepID=UPI00340009B2